MIHVWPLISGIIEIILISYMLYRIFLFIRGTRAEQVAKGFAVLIIAAFVARIAQFHTIGWLLKNIFAIWIIAVLIVFQPELRRVLASLGKGSIFGYSWREEQIIDELIKSINFLSRKKIGALIVLEREIGLRGYIETGVEIDGKVTSELINSIFMKATPLHDGALIIQNERIASAGCILPVSESLAIPKELGTRHRAAVGVSEETDALTVLISEETGKVAIATKGKLNLELDIATVRNFLKSLYIKKSLRKPFFQVRKLAKTKGVK